jgi:hypothetical protein
LVLQASVPVELKVTAPAIVLSLSATTPRSVSGVTEPASLTSVLNGTNRKLVTGEVAEWNGGDPIKAARPYEIGVLAMAPAFGFVFASPPG